MARKRKVAEPLPTIWRVPDALGEHLVPILRRYDSPARTGRPRIAPKTTMEAIIVRLRTGCQWNHLPREFPDDSSVHRTLQRWVQRGVFVRLWQELVEECAELGGVDWNSQAADGALGQGPPEGDAAGPNPADRGKNW